MTTEQPDDYIRVLPLDFKRKLGAVIKHVAEDLSKHLKGNRPTTHRYCPWKALTWQIIADNFKPLKQLGFITEWHCQMDANTNPPGSKTFVALVKLLNSDGLWHFEFHIDSKKIEIFDYYGNSLFVMTTNA